MRLLLALLVLLVGASQASAGNPCVGNHTFVGGGSPITGAKLNEFAESDVTAYAMGFMDAWSIAGLMGSSENCMRRVGSCTAGRTGKQFGAMVRKYLRDNPAEWHLHGALIVYKAILMDCLNN